MKNERRAYRLAALVGAIVAGSQAASASAVSLGAATGYNAFLFSNFTGYNTDSEGRMAVGGNFITSGFTIASNMGADKAGVFDLVVGGNYTNSYNRIGGGDIFVGGDMNWTGPTLPNNAYVNGNVTNNGWGSVGGKIYYGGKYSSAGTLDKEKLKTPMASPIDFLSAQTELKFLSASLASQAATDKVDDNGYGTYTLAGSSKSINVFNLSKANYSGSTLNISAPSGSTVIINIAGSEASFRGGSINISGVDQHSVIFNFNSATTLSLSSIGFNGTILAPSADVTGSWGNLNGQLIANSLSGTTELHDYLFTGTLAAPGLPAPDISAAPEPSTWAMIGGALVLLGVARRRRADKATRA